jgi:nucleoside-diphosphate-sugar epimerase
VRVFVAGATGVVGRRLIPLLTHQGDAVTAIVRSPEKRPAFARVGAAPISVDLFDPAALHAALRGYDAVVNLATHMPSPPWRMMLRSAWAENDRVRREGSANLVDAAIASGVARFVQESFAPIYPHRGDRWIGEETPIEPVAYNRSIIEAERSAERFTDSGRIGVVLRFGAFYGPDAGHLADTIRMVKRGWAPMPGPAESFVSSVSHDDAASAAAAALIAEPGTYNVADDEPVTHREYFDSLAAALGVPPPRLPPPWATPLFGSLGKLLARSQRISNLRFRAATQWEPRYRSVREGWPAAVAVVDVREPAA